MYLHSLFATAVLFAAAANSYAITGPTGGVNVNTGQRPFRQEISNFQKSGAAWDLYILAFQKFTQTDQAQQLSYYQVAGVLEPLEDMVSFTDNALGVHGRPYIPWDGVSGIYRAVSIDRRIRPSSSRHQLLGDHIAPMPYSDFIWNQMSDKGSNPNFAHHSGLLYSWIHSVPYLAPSLHVTL